jgi:hypothetical protein
VTKHAFPNVLSALVLARTLALAPSDARAEDDRIHVRQQISLGAASGNNVLPAPFAVRLSELVERGTFGFEAGFQLNPATLCENGSGRDGHCGLLLTADVGPRVSAPLTEHLVAYVSTLLQWLRMTRASTNEWGAALRLGLAYQGQRFGAFLEGGPTILFGSVQEYPTVRSSGGRSAIVPMAMVGIRL